MALVEKNVQMDQHAVTADRRMRTRSDIAVDPISHNEWRISDRRFDEHDAPSVLGMIERSHDGFTVLEIDDCVSERHTQTFEEAVTTFVTETI